MSVSFEVEDRIAVVTLDRPGALNALDLESLRELRAHLQAFRDRDDLRVAILTGAGNKAFCAGADLKGTATSAATYAEAMFRSVDASAQMGLYVRLMDITDLALAKPIIAAVNGHCLGAGLELALQCDLRIASSNATFGLPEARVGSIPAVSGLHRLLKAIPSAHAMQMALTGEKVDARAALACGLISDVCDHAELRERALDLARRVASNAPLAVQAIKRLSRHTQHLSEVDAQALTELYWGVLRDTEDRREGRAAFAEKRAPRYAGR
jgi:E-phenylitaconyl-CoA hydratase